MSQPAEVISLSAFKAHLSEVISRVERTGSPVIVTRRGRPVVRLLPVPGGGGPRPAGLWRGKMDRPEGWDQFTDQDQVDWYGVDRLPSRPDDGTVAEGR
ncbi:MAG: type II toxin-antitoxin system Phd/YefM family antitoxin [Propionibacteriaceae bacterium]|nr:type II toxin-antitoxin system Phd/YefM family antitoxin [Propionibacteriaceae bacterium]